MIPKSQDVEKYTTRFATKLVVVKLSFMQLTEIHSFRAVGLTSNVGCISKGNKLAAVNETTKMQAQSVSGMPRCVLDATVS